jgi:hypothetical protein
MAKHLRRPPLAKHFKAVILPDFGVIRLQEQRPDSRVGPSAGHGCGSAAAVLDFPLACQDSRSASMNGRRAECRMTGVGMSTASTRRSL